MKSTIMKHDSTRCNQELQQLFMTSERYHSFGNVVVILEMLFNRASFR